MCVGCRCWSCAWRPTRKFILYCFTASLMPLNCFTASLLQMLVKSVEAHPEKKMTVLLLLYCFFTASLLLYCFSLFTADVGEARGGGRAGAEARVCRGVWRQGGDTEAPRHVRAQRQQVAFLEGTASLLLLTALLRTQRQQVAFLEGTALSCCAGTHVLCWHTRACSSNCAFCTSKQALSCSAVTAL